MDHNSYLVWWLLGVPIVLAIVDRVTMGGSSAGAARREHTVMASAGR